MAQVTKSGDLTGLDPLGKKVEDLVFIYVSKQRVLVFLPYPGAVPLITKRRTSLMSITATYILCKDQKPALAKGLSENGGLLPAKWES